MVDILQRNQFVSDDSADEAGEEYEMNELLKRWRELEPDRFHKILLAPINDPDNEIDPNILMRIQWAVQTAIVERGWSFELKYESDCPDPRNPYDATVDSDTSSGWGFSSDNIVGPLLTAYLETLEGQ